MTKQELVFTIDYGIKSMEFACGNDDCFTATFVDNDGQTFKFNASREMVFEHIKRFSKKPQEYENNKALVVQHFHNMAIAWYKTTHFPTKVKSVNLF